MTLPGSRALAALLAMGLLLGADLPPKGKGDPQSTFEPRSQPGVGQKFLQKLPGDWDVIKTLHIRPEDPIRMTGECRQTMIHGGRFLQCEFVFQRDGAKTTGLGVIGFDAETGTFTSVWTDSRTTRMSLRQSRGPFNGEEIVLHDRSLNDDGKVTYRSRTVTRLEEDGRKIVHRVYVTVPDGKERLFMELLMTRKATAP